jgi:hypothetical protein
MLIQKLSYNTIIFFQEHTRHEKRTYPLIKCYYNTVFQCTRTSITIERNLGNSLFENGIKAHTSRDEPFNNTLKMSRGRPEYPSQAKEERRQFDTSIYVYDASISNHRGGLFSHPHPQPGEERLPLQGQQEQRVQRKREMNVIHSRRKRERQKIEVEVLRDRCSQLSANNLTIFHQNKRLEELLAKANSMVSQSLAGGGMDDNNTMPSSCDDTHHSGDVSPAEATASATATPTSTSSRLPASLSSSASSHVGVAGGGLLSAPLARTGTPEPMLPPVNNNMTDRRSNSLYHLVQQQRHRQQQQQQHEQLQQQGAGNNHGSLQTNQQQQQQLQLHQQQLYHQRQQNHQLQQGDHQMQLAMLRRLAASSGIPGSESLRHPNTTSSSTSSTTSGSTGPPFTGATGRLAGNMSDVPTLLQLQMLRQHQEQQRQQQQQLATTATNHPTAAYDQWMARGGTTQHHQQQHQQQQPQQQYPNAFALGNYSGIPSAGLARTIPDATTTASLRALLSRNDDTRVE